MAEEARRREGFISPLVGRWVKDYPIIVGGRGAILVDIDGREYIDAFGPHSATSIGHGHPDVIKAIKDQADKLEFMTVDFATLPQLELAELLAKISPGGLKRCYFLSGGAEAVESALLMARKASGRREIIALYGAFHGRTYGARSLLGWSKPYKMGMNGLLAQGGILHAPGYYCYRCSLGLEYPGCGLQCAKMIEEIITYASVGDVGAFIAEPIQGTAGNIPAPQGYFKEVKKILDRNGILFIDDEVITGFGKTGRMFAADLYGVEPDIMTLAKGISGGLPLSCTICTERVAEHLQAFDYFTTWGGNPVACAQSIAAINVIQRERLAENAERLGSYFLRRLEEIAEHHKLIGDVRGRGLLIGVELVKDQETKEPAVEESLRLRAEGLKRGVILPAGLGWRKNTIRLSPPLCITTGQVDKVVEAIDEGLKEVEG